MISLQTAIKEVSSIGPAYQRRLEKMGIATVRDLLYHFPARYDDFSEICNIDEVRAGKTWCVQGTILEIGTSKTYRRWMDMTEAVIEDKTGQIRAIWFNQPYIEKSLKGGDFVCLAGKAATGKGGLYFAGPAYEKTSEIAERHTLTHTGRIVPVYHETKGVTSRWLRYAIKPLLVKMANQVPDILPPELRDKHRFLPVQRAMWQAHFPDSFEAADAAKARFSFEELLVLQLAVLTERAKLQRTQAPALPLDAQLMKRFTDSLPFQLTDSQRQCAYQILKDMEKSVPMSRLLEGDVGSGKTVVAAMASLNAAAQGWQVAFMAPTEILAKQHFAGLSGLLNAFDISIGLLTGKEARISKKGAEEEVKPAKLREDIKTHQVQVAIGTHALIGKNVEFDRLALVVLDEQHRFGVSQRAALTQKKQLVPHLLSMTATPIPRTLALTVYGDLDISLIKEMPKNRKPINTLVVDARGRKEAYEFMRKEANAGRGIFVICPKIEARSLEPGAGTVDVGRLPDLGVPVLIKSVKEEYETLAKDIFPDLRVAMLHGKMKPQEKELIMLDFRNGEIDILVSTSVVEVGVDVPRATVMVVEGAERFGLAQLHQFRGRVGRSDLQSYCLLFTTSPDQFNRKRLKAMVDHHSGFELAQIDLKIRGPGQLYGNQQWGLPDMAMQSLSNIFLVEKTRNAAKDLLEQDPGLAAHPLLQERVQGFNQHIHFE